MKVCIKIKIKLVKWLEWGKRKEVLGGRGGEGRNEWKDVCQCPVERFAFIICFYHFVFSYSQLLFFYFLLFESLFLSPPPPSPPLLHSFARLYLLFFDRKTLKGVAFPLFSRDRPRYLFCKTFQLFSLALS